jgi:hypothetical protein
MADLGVDGNSMVSAQGTSFLIFASFVITMAADQSRQNFENEKPEMLKLPIKEVVADILESSTTDWVINALNMPSSAFHPNMDIYR